MLRLSPLDTMFLFLKRRNAPFHVRALGLFRPAKNASRDFGAQLAERLNRSSHAVAPFDRRLVSRHGLEFWGSDSDFDLAHLFVHLALPTPGRMLDLPVMVARQRSTPLDRTYPLWCTYLIDGLDDGRIAAYSKIHHSMVDGVAGIGLTLKGMSPNALTSTRIPAPWDLKPKRKPSDPKFPSVGACKAVLGLTSSGMKLVPAVFNPLKLVVKDFRAGNPALVTSFQAPRSTFNRRITRSRRLAARSYSRPRIRALGIRLGGATNDVVLALCATTLRRYLSARRVLPDEPPIATVPVSIPRDECDGGNEVAVALVNLATHLANPIQRFNAIKASVGLLACPRSVPHMQRLSDYLQDAMVELESATRRVVAKG
ncbi:MAG: wax ester/triacylglycerol synthase domain-containing protein [Panacagrimonas sp.]